MTAGATRGRRARRAASTREHAHDVVPGLGVRRNAVIALDRLRSGVVARDGELGGVRPSGKVIHQRFEIRRRTAQVVGRIPRVHAEQRSGVRHQLTQPARTDARYCVRTPRGLDRHDRHDEAWIEMRAPRIGHHRARVGARFLGGNFGLIVRSTAAYADSLGAAGWARAAGACGRRRERANGKAEERSGNTQR